MLLEIQNVSKREVRERGFKIVIRAALRKFVKRPINKIIKIK